MNIPATLDEARSETWLSSILGEDVIHVVSGPVDNRVSTNAPVRVTLADGRDLDLWIKGYFTEAGGLLRFAGVPEAHFYRDLVDHAGVRTLRCLHAEVDPVTSNNVVVTVDAGPVTFPDGREPLTPDLVARSLGELAKLHAATWMNPACAAPWLTSRLSLYTISRGLAEIRQNFDGELGAGVPLAARNGERLIAAFQGLATEVEAADPWCVVHGDAHIRNIFIDATGSPSFIDWQLVQRGPWYLDVGYHIATMLSVDDRREHQDALVRGYLDRLVSAGVPRPDDREVERGLRRSFVHGFYLWAITLRVDPLVIAALLERLGTAVADHDAYEELAP